VESASDPLVISLLTGGAKPDLLQIITTDSAPIISRCSQRPDDDADVELGARQRRGRRRAGQGHRAAGHEFMSPCRQKPTTLWPRPGPIDDTFAERYGVVDTP